MKIKLESFSEKICLVGAVVNAIALITYCIYGVEYNYFDIVVFLALAIGLASATAYVYLSNILVEFLNLVCIVFDSYALGLFFLNSYPVWADRLNHITMYASRGTLVPVVIIIVMLLVTILCEIVSCFTWKGKVQ